MFRTSRSIRLNLECLESREVPATIVGVTQGNAVAPGGVLYRFDSATPGQVITIGAVTGLNPNDSIVEVAFRPATAELYGLGFNRLFGTVQIYKINPTTAVATPLGTPFSSGTEGAPGTGMTFDPTSDKIRIVLDIGGGFETDRLFDPDTGAFFAANGNVMGGGVETIAHTNPFPGAATTELYGYNFRNEAIVKIDPTTGNVTQLNTSGLNSEFGLMALAIGGDNAAYFVEGNSSFNGQPSESLYSVDLTTGNLALIGAFADQSLAFTSIAVAPAVQFSVGGYPSPVTPGTQGTATVTALDVYGQVVPGYRGTVTLTSTDPAAAIQPAHTLTNGTGTFTVTLNTVGTQMLVATDPVSTFITGNQPGIVVQQTSATPTTTTTSTTTTTVGGPRSVSEVFGPNGTVLVLVTEDGTLMRFDAFSIHTLASNVRSANVSLGPTGEVLLVVFDNGVLVQFDAFGPRVLLGGGVQSASAAFGRAGETLLVVGENGMLGQFDSTGLHVLAGGGVKSASIAFGPMGQVIVVAMQTGEIFQIDSSGMRQIGTGKVRFLDATFLPGQSLVYVVLFDDTAMAYQFDEFGSRLVL